MDKEKFIVETTEFAELKRELDVEFRREPLYAGENVKACALKSALDKMLDLLDEFVRS